MNRRISKTIHLGSVPIGGGAPIAVQSMTKTDTRDAKATIRQIKELQEYGCEIIRAAVPDMEAAAAIVDIKKGIKIPLVADIHFDYRLALAALKGGVDGLRLNPGNIGEPEKIKKVVLAAKERGVPIRIGLNAGSLPAVASAQAGLPKTNNKKLSVAERMVAAALEQVKLLESLDFDLIKVSLKASDVPTTLEAYRNIADKIPYPLHIGITEAGTPRAGIIRSAVGIGALLWEGIGDTLRVSLTAPPREEVIYYVIEVNPRVSRSSALASKATGYPIARVAAKIAAGKTLDEIPNAVTGKTMASFEPALDYVVVKIPRWPFDKFATGDRVIGTQMKATGEVMAIDRTFEAALQKAVRSLEFGKKTLNWEDPGWTRGTDIRTYPLMPANDVRLWAIMAALRRGITPEAIADYTKIDRWFLDKLQNIVNMEKTLLSETLTPDLLWRAKRLGFSDAQISTLADRLPEQVRQLRYAWRVRPVYKMVDTCAAEFDAATPYFYSAYEQENEAIPENTNKAVVIGSGPIRIGQGIEFDYCSVHAARALQHAGYKSIMINSNPETVSTDFDTSDRLYFEALDEESVRDILENESSAGGGSGFVTPPPSIVQFGGQTAVNLSQPLSRAGMPLIGSSADAIDLASDRKRFEHFLEGLAIAQPPGAGVTSLDEGLKIAEIIGYPVLVRPSYVLGGRAMEIVYNATELVRFMKLAMELDTGHPVLIDKYLQGKECEVDAIGDGESVLIPGIMEHIERAGVHSGDSMAVYPGINFTRREVNTLIDYAVRIGLGLKIKGLMNIQFVIMPGKDGKESSVYVIEVNPRASRTVPFLSKVTGVPMVKVATNVMLGKSLKEQGYNGGLWPAKKLIAVKAPVFSMSKLTGVDTHLGPEMKSTGEVMGIDYTFEAALGKAILAAGLALPPDCGVLFSIADRDKSEALPIIRKLSAAGIKLYATEGTAAMIEAAGMPVKMTSKKLNEGHPNIIDLISDGTISGVVNTLTGGHIPVNDGFQIRRAAAEKRIPCFTSLDTIRAATETIAHGVQSFTVQPLPDYRNKKAG